MEMNFRTTTGAIISANPQTEQLKERHWMILLRSRALARLSLRFSCVNRSSTQSENATLIPPQPLWPSA